MNVMASNQTTNLSIKDTREDDLIFSREIYIRLIEKNLAAIDTMMAIASDSESPRANEVLGNLIKSAADITDKISALHKSQKDLSTSKDVAVVPSGVTNTTNNNIAFVGTTSDFQRMLKDTLSNVDKTKKDHHSVIDSNSGDIIGLKIEDLQDEYEA